MNISHFYPQSATFYHYYFILGGKSKEKVQNFSALLSRTFNGFKE